MIFHKLKDRDDINRGCKPLPQSFADDLLKFAIFYCQTSKKIIQIGEAVPLEKKLRPLTWERFLTAIKIDHNPL
jgi:hypothetical protein